MVRKTSVFPTIHLIRYLDHGAALNVQLTSPRMRRVYSTPENTKSNAQVVCAQTAIACGVLDFIKFGGGQVRPSSPNPPTSDRGTAMVWSNVQEFINTLPRPFPESEFEDNPQKVEDGILQWFNKLRQDANKTRAHPLKFHFHFLQVKHGEVPVFLYLRFLSSISWSISVWLCSSY